ncbi:hypothetical protein BJ138DRAFT_1144235 [Hygrophoropsis aurantiaca]|uniref:Uncharacterized protein n=1 Tax=Hygrophoropsis aurantiaca TaxID=72124 RepID=A0ACB8ALZ7_9AGAM|nr:hypothetical protein BJ138DRAFT_1144235 [Hygrophoropsis aurantiaca]
MYKLPLKAWSFGCKLYSADDDSSQLFFEYFPGTRPKITISSSSPQYSMSFLPDREATRVTITSYTNSSLGAPVIQFHETYVENLDYKYLHEGSYTPGSMRPSGCLTFMFSVSETQGWAVTAYQEMVESLKTKCFATNNAKNKHESIKHETIRPSAGEAIWNRVEQAAMLDEIHQSRKSHSEESASVAIATSPPTDILSESGQSTCQRGEPPVASSKPEPNLSIPPRRPDLSVLVSPSSPPAVLSKSRQSTRQTQFPAASSESEQDLPIPPQILSPSVLRKRSNVSVIEPPPDDLAESTKSTRQKRTAAAVSKPLRRSSRLSVVKVIPPPLPLGPDELCECIPLIIHYF